ncbi:chemotaxis protein CheB [Kineosporia sp. NBRC 101677]|uniref:chemotaxis protein CheB n=1 Tax=Kineosporia sp. NBRC 101677 TaxID=3032197 RepID=UPI00249FFDE6|nr:chemotaxis protein CheB [Kineosporia sp. NBRC 101677]GLY16001.1 chemotaxis protein CheB [Kineosporia sp. NBRC 101677]
MAQRDVVVVGASAGGVEAITKLLSPLPADLPACVLVVLHTPPSGVNALATILDRVTALRVVAAQGETPLARGTVIVARPDHHLLVVDDRAILTRGPRENGHRPAVDVLFRSAARALGPRVIGVVLSGALDDGSAGLVSVRNEGGVAVVQDPRDASQPSMPRSAIAAVTPDVVLPVADLPAALMELIGVEVPQSVPGPDHHLLEQEIAVSRMDPEAIDAHQRPGVAAGLSCPDCHGPLFEIDENGYLRYRCRVGHAWSVQSLLAQTDAALEGALWMALRTLEEKSSLAADMGERATQRDQPLAAARFNDQATESRSAAGLIRRMLLERSDDGDGSPAEAAESA